MAAVGVIWGVNFTALKLGLRAFEPFALAGFRFATGSAVLWLLVAGRTPLAGLSSRRFWVLVGLGVLGNTIYQAMFMTGLSLTTATSSSMIVAALPVLVALMGTLLGLEPASPSTWAAVLLGTAGVVLVVTGGAPAELGGGSLRGDLLVLLATLCWAGYTIGVRRAGAGVDQLVVTAIVTIAGTPGLVLLGLPGLLRADWGAVSLTVWVAIAYSALGSIVVAYWLYNRGVQALGASRAALYNCLTPIAAATVAWLALGERMGLRQLLGVALVIAGVVVSVMAHFNDARAAVTCQPEP